MQDLRPSARGVRPEQTLEARRQRWIQEDDIGRDARRHPQAAFSAVGDVDHAAVMPQTSRDTLRDGGRSAGYHNQQHVSAWHISSWVKLIRQRVQHDRTQLARRRGGRAVERP